MAGIISELVGIIFNKASVVFLEWLSIPPADSRA